LYAIYLNGEIYCSYSVINVGGYIGTSTKSEIEDKKVKGNNINYLNKKLKLFVTNEKVRNLYNWRHENEEGV
jgi:hypothetical protein